jgi:SsrA-binding protein
MNLLVNKKAKFNYEILESFEAGMKLSGSEVKSLRKKDGSLREAYVTIDDEVWLIGAHIPPFQAGHTMYESYDSYRKRKLLLNKKEIEKIKTSLKQKGLTIVPIRIYDKGGLIKAEIAIARGKQKQDKRNTLKDRASKRDVLRAIKFLR